MNQNSLSTLIGQYTSDSENDDEVSNKMVTEMKTFLDEINPDNATSTMPTTSWTQCMDPNTGHPYYWNIETKEVTWEKPDEYENYLKYMTNIASKPLNNCWTIGYSDDTKTPYYVNEFTRVVSWEKPPTSDTISTKENIVPVTKKKCSNSKKFSEHSDDEKIELITSYSVHTESSSDEENGDKKDMPKNFLLSITSAQPNLVAAYQTDSESETNDAEHNLSLTQLENSTMNEKNSSQNTNATVLENVRSRSISPSALNIQTNSFASIITGGKGETAMDAELKKLKEELEKDIEEVGDVENSFSAPIVAGTIFNDKTFQRKRRIELKTANTSKDSDLANVTRISEVNTVDNTKKNLYTNFQRSHIEFAKISTSSPDDENSKLSENTETNDEHLNKSEIIDLCGLIGEKVKFLSAGKPEISAVQIISIQLETLANAFHSTSLDAEYFFKWLKATSDDLAELEQNAAPDGWECKWDRQNSQYCYSNVRTGESQWEFPKDEIENKNVELPSEAQQFELIRGEDEMDISTTPPPNEHEHLKFENETNVWDADNAPPPPMISNAQSQSATNSMSASAVLKPINTDINCELECFYSDIAALQTPILQETLEHKDSVIINDKREAEEIKIKRKRKKLKVQGLGSKMKEVSTMVANWQKAQRELDN